MSLPCLPCLRTALSNEVGWERIKPMLECSKGHVQNTCARCKAKHQGWADCKTVWVAPSLAVIANSSRSHDNLKRRSDNCLLLLNPPQVEPDSGQAGASTQDKNIGILRYQVLGCLLLCLPRITFQDSLGNLSDTSPKAQFRPMHPPATIEIQNRRLKLRPGGLGAPRSHFPGTEKDIA